MRTCSGSPFQAFLMYSLFHSNIRQLFMLYLNFSPYYLKGHVNLEIFGLVHLNHAAGFLHSNSGVKMS